MKFEMLEELKSYSLNMHLKMLIVDEQIALNTIKSY